MSKSITFKLLSGEGLGAAAKWLNDNCCKALTAGPVIITLGREKRSLSQNNKQWVLLNDISSQVEWYGERLTPEEYKWLLTAAVKGTKCIRGVDGGVVMMGQSTSDKDKDWFSELIEYYYYFGSDRGVKWSKQSTDIYNQYKEAQK